MRLGWMRLGPLTSAVPPGRLSGGWWVIRPSRIRNLLMSTVVVINRDQMGAGDRELGRRILGTCLRKLPSFDGLEAIVLYNSGVKLAVKGSELAGELALLHERGIEVLSCGTCLEHFGIKDELLFERASNMEEILATLRAADKVITL